MIVGLANVALLLGQAGALIHALYESSDNAAGLVLPTLASRTRPGTVVVLGTHAWYEAWWFMRATIGLPGHLQIWEAAPFVVALAGVCVVCWCAAVTVGRVAALTCGVGLLAMSVAVRGVLLVPEARVGLILHAGVLCGALLVVDRIAARGEGRHRTTVAIGALVVAFTAAGATDQMLVLAGVVPYVFAPCVIWWCDRSPTARTVAVFAIATGLLSLVGAAVLTSVMRSAHVVPTALPVALVSFRAIRLNLQHLFIGWTTLAGGALGTPANLPSLPAFGSAVLSLGALAGVASALYRRAERLTRRRLSSAGRRRALYVSFWACALALVLAGYVLTTAGSQLAERYLLGAWVAVAALTGAFARRERSRAALLVGVALFGGLALRANLVNGVRPYGVAPNQATAALIAHFALEHGASVGYTGYWDALPVNLETGFQVTEIPIIACGKTEYCGFKTVAIDSWYAVRPSASTFLVTDSQPTVTPSVATASPAFGHPAASARFGAFTVFVYRHDLSAELGPQS